MRKRFGLLWALVVLGAALALPATTAAGGGGYTYTVLQNYCYGPYNSSSVYFKVKNQAAGWTDANKLTIEAWAQEKNGSWYNIYHWAKAIYSYYRDGSKHWLTRWYSWEPNSSASVYWHRIKLRLRAWDGSYLLASKVLYSKQC
jgi:hypothetical protein